MKSICIQIKLILKLTIEILLAPASVQKVSTIVVMETIGI